ncbi:hypothetical protein HID58_081129 [Brassica napus]|uniref:Uncharacterized protein n=1 Tax=Brassica napus TaxID=3708 RepID=A0ABQ7Y6U3_BRANA|nr:hypothetical protein HID58_081129 [Brassica napus]
MWYPPSPALASGKGVSFRFVFAGFWLRRAEASKAPRCRLGTRCSFGLSSVWLSSRWGWITADEISVDDEALWRGNDFQGKKPSFAVIGLRPFTGPGPFI